VLQSWSDRFIRNARLQLVMAQEVVLRLEYARGRRQLAPHEEALRHSLKLRSLALASLQRTIARHESRLLWLSEGDAPTRFFHVHANSRRRCNFIHSLKHEEHTVIDEEQKVDVAFSFFDNILGSPLSLSATINLDVLDIPRIDVSCLEDRFTEAEVLEVIKSLPPDKASSPDGFTARFVQVSWSVIRPPHYEGL
jgi:hypothetical protein